MTKLKKFLRRTLIIVMCLTVLCVGAVFGVNAYVKNIGREYMVNPGDYSAIENADCILVLGCQVRDDGTPSDIAP